MNVTHQFGEFTFEFCDGETLAAFEPLLPLLVRTPEKLAGYQPFQARRDKPVRVFRFRLGKKTYFAKRARGGSRVDRLKNLFAPSKARLALRNSERLLALGFHTPKLVCLAERRRAGLVEESLLISEGIPQVWKLRQFLYQFGDQRDARRLLMRSLGELLGQLHQAGIYHSDLRSTNILVQQDDRALTLYLVDTEAARFSPPISRSRRLKNFCVVNLTWAKSLTLTDRLRVFRAYADALGLGREARSELLRDVVAACLRSMHEYIAKPAIAPYQIPAKPTYREQVKAITTALESRLRQKGELAGQFPDPLEEDD